MYGLCRQTVFHPAGPPARSAVSVLLSLLVVCCALWLVPAHAMVEANSAPAADLMAIKGIGPATSQKILEARQQAPFADWADLVKRVKGVGAKTAVKMSDSGLRVNGQAWPVGFGSGSGSGPSGLPAPRASPDRAAPPAGAKPEPAPRLPAPSHLPAAPRWNPQ